MSIYQLEENPTKCSMHPTRLTIDRNINIIAPRESSQKIRLDRLYGYKKLMPKVLVMNLTNGALEGDPNEV